MGCCGTKESIVSNELDVLSSCKDDDFKNIPVFSFMGQTHTAKVVDVYDGDTITVVFQFLGKIVKTKVRMAGINAPELKTGNDKINGAVSRDMLKELILDKYITLYCGKWDPYTRVIGVVMYEGKNINKFMLDNKLAVPFMIDEGIKAFEPGAGCAVWMEEYKK